MTTFSKLLRQITFSFMVCALWAMPLQAQTSSVSTVDAEKKAVCKVVDDMAELLKIRFSKANDKQRIAYAKAFWDLYSIEKNCKFVGVVAQALNNTEFSQINMAVVNDPNYACPVCSQIASGGTSATTSSVATVSGTAPSSSSSILMNKTPPTPLQIDASKLNKEVLRKQ